MRFIHLTTAFGPNQRWMKNHFEGEANQRPIEYFFLKSPRNSNKMSCIGQHRLLIFWGERTIGFINELFAEKRGSPINKEKNEVHPHHFRKNVIQSRIPTVDLHHSPFPPYLSPSLIPPLKLFHHPSFHSTESFH